MTNKLLVVGSVPTTPSIFEVILECQNMPETVPAMNQRLLNNRELEQQRRI